MTNYIYNMVDLKKVVNGKEILKDIYLSFLPGAKIGVLGQNGAGKSSLLKIMAGVDQNFDGEAFPAKGTKVGFLPQEPVLDETKTVKENVVDGMGEIKALLDEFDALNEKLGEPMGDDEMQKCMDRLGNLQDELDAKDAWDLDRTIDIAMDALRCPPGDSSVENLSGGEKRRVALCKLLLSKPDLLLLDEPTNHLDAESVHWLERFLQDFTGTVVAVTHDRYFLDNAAGWILELDRGQGIPWKGNYSSWLEQKQKRLASEEKTESARQRTLKRELEWVQMAPKARHAKGKARLARFDELMSQDVDKVDKLKEISIPAGPRLGDNVIDAKEVCKSFDEKLLFDELNFRLPPGGIVGVIGANGAGKTTLFKMLTGEENPDRGELKIGDSVKISYVDQNRSTLNGENSVFEEVCGGEDVMIVAGREVQSRAYLAKFGFRGADQNKLVQNLSGGERNRLNLAKLLIQGGNVLLLDEPTNDLDVDTLRALEDAIVSFPGCAVIISHDRWFLDRIATHILAFEGDSHVEWFEGNYQDYLVDKKRRLGEDALKPSRIKYKKLVH